MSWPVRMVPTPRTQALAIHSGVHCHWKYSGLGTLCQCFQQGQEGWDRHLWSLRIPPRVSHIPNFIEHQNLRHHLWDSPVYTSSCFLCPYLALYILLLCDLTDKESRLYPWGKEYSIGLDLSWGHLFKCHLHIDLCLKCFFFNFLFLEAEWGMKNQNTTSRSSIIAFNSRRFYVSSYIL